MDFLKGSFIRMCIITEPNNNSAKPRAAGCLKLGNQMATNNNRAKITFKVPMR